MNWRALANGWAILSWCDHPMYSQGVQRSEEHTSELQSRLHLVCRLLLEKKKTSYQSSRRKPSPSHSSTTACPFSFLSALTGLSAHSASGKHDGRIIGGRAPRRTPRAVSP